MAAGDTQSSSLPPAQPAYILRGHTAQIHSVHFFRQNLRLLTGDADGWVVLWDVPIKRPVVVWKPHEATVLGLGSWGEKIITHGRDNNLHVWQMRPEDEDGFSTVLPIEDASTQRPAPWLLHTLTVNTLNFCSFAMCHTPGPEDCIFIAVPGLQDGMINITSLPSESRVATIPQPKDLHTGMLMAVTLTHLDNGDHVILAGYETGHVARWQQQNQHWTCTYLSKPHAQPVLSLSLSQELGCCFSSSADAVIARHSLLPGSNPETKLLQTKHAGQQSLTIRSDGKIFATAGWDGRVRVYSTKTMAELAVLKWHKEGVYAVGFGEILEGDERGEVVRVRERRKQREMRTHWLAAGSKDGKVSLWEIY